VHVDEPNVVSKDVSCDIFKSVCIVKVGDFGTTLSGKVKGSSNVQMPIKVNPHFP